MLPRRHGRVPSGYPIAPLQSRFLQLLFVIRVDYNISHLQTAVLTYILLFGCVFNNLSYIAD